MKRIVLRIYIMFMALTAIAQLKKGDDSYEKIITFIVLTTISFNIMAQQKIVQTAGRTQLGEQD